MNSPEIRRNSDQDAADFVARMQFKALNERIPITGSFEITHRCNLKCVHCYLGDQQEIREHHQDELSTNQVKAIFDEVVDAGMLNMSITGGDPMMRKDFPELYTYLIRKGVLVTVFSDAVLITDKIIALFLRYQPRTVEVSVYGATEETYEKVTQVKGSYLKFRRGIDKLKENGLRFILKTVLMTVNKHELVAMEALADEYDVAFHYDSAIFPCVPHEDNQGNSNLKKGSVLVDFPEFNMAANPVMDPLGLRVSPEEIVDIDFSTAQRQDKWLGIYDHEKDKAFSDKLFQCGAGLTGFHVDPYGLLHPCVITESISYDLKKGSFSEGWAGEMAGMRETVADDEYECNSCEARPICGGCPGVFELENGSPHKKSAYMCETTQLRYKKLKSLVVSD